MSVWLIIICHYYISRSLLVILRMSIWLLIIGLIKSIILYATTICLYATILCLYSMRILAHDASQEAYSHRNETSLQEPSYKLT
jgi:hypothetical protein